MRTHIWARPTVHNCPTCFPVWIGNRKRVLIKGVKHCRAKIALFSLVEGTEQVSACPISGEIRSLFASLIIWRSPFSVPVATFFWFGQPATVDTSALFSGLESN